jgi:uncharacterized protein YycO
MKKTLLLIALVCMLALQTEIHSFQVIEAVADTFKTWVADPVLKVLQDVECNTKGVCRTVYRPAPGYSAGDNYWNATDIKNHFADFQNEYTFDNNSPPIEALAMLPGNPADYSHVAGIASPAKLTAVTPAVDFPLSSYRSSLRKGDIYFSRSATIAAEIGQYFTSWFHAGVFVNPQSERGRTFESQVNTGVFESDIISLGKAYSWSVKRIKSSKLSSSWASQAVDNGIQKYNGKPYFPRLFQATRMRENFIAEWADKTNDSSYYCSKLVWRIYKDVGVDLDSERTISKVNLSFREAFTGAGFLNKYAWIGVSADDIYYSPHLDRDIVLIGAENLAKALPDIIRSL